MLRKCGGKSLTENRASSFLNRVKSNRVSSLQLSNQKEIVSPHRAAVNSLQLDLTESRYLLSTVGSIHQKHKAILVVDKHKYAVSPAAWYPVETGLFVTGSYDHHVNVWDTNTAQMVMNFKLPWKVYKTATQLATSHMLIAAGTEDVQVRLCDCRGTAME